NGMLHLLEQEREFRASLYKKYRGTINIVDGAHNTLALACLGLGASGVGLLTTVVAAPVVVVLETRALGCGLAGIATKLIARRLQAKARKHDQIRVPAETKLDTISE
ncbi:hypothetical protein LSAT2_018536, partial [Lamellibrachia satsuma]